MSLGAGEVFAGYTVVRQIGSGGMGEVYLAKHPRLPRQDALKVLPASVSSDGPFRARFEREADLAATLWHPHIVGVHDRGEHEGLLWISMDYVDGSDAGALLRDEYPDGMPPELVADIVTAIGDALDYAHERHLLHRDIKPANILLTAGPRRRVLLADFGIARRSDDASGLTATNMTVGTVAYTAPEQLMGEELDGRVDQYSLAATAYHLLTGAAPFAHSNQAVVISRHLSTAPPALAESRPELSDAGPAITRALAKDPKARFDSCAAFASALREGLSAEGSEAANAAEPTGNVVRPTEVIEELDSPTTLLAEATPEESAPTTMLEEAAATARIDEPVPAVSESAATEVSDWSRPAFRDESAPITTPPTFAFTPPPPATPTVAAQMPPMPTMPPFQAMPPAPPMPHMPGMPPAGYGTMPPGPPGAPPGAGKPILIGLGVVVAVILAVVLIVSLSGGDDDESVAGSRTRTTTTDGPTFSQTFTSGPTTTFQAPTPTARPRSAPPAFPGRDAYGESCPNGYDLPGGQGQWGSSAVRGSDATTCLFVRNVLSAYWAAGAPVPFRTIDVGSAIDCRQVGGARCNGSLFIMDCRDEDNGITCRGGRNAVVRLW